MQILGLATLPTQDPDLTRAHKHGMRNRSAVLANQTCGCFYRLAIFPLSDITEWPDEEEQTAECPKCGIAAVLGSASALPVTRHFVQEMNNPWFRIDP